MILLSLAKMPLQNLNTCLLAFAVNDLKQKVY